MAVRVIPYLICRDVPATIDFLSRAFGFTEETRHETPSGGVHAEMALEGQHIMLGQGANPAEMRPPADMPGTVATAGIFVYLEEVDAHHDQAAAAGATIIHPPENVPYCRTYAARDPDGHPWFFTRAPKLSASQVT